MNRQEQRRLRRRLVQEVEARVREALWQQARQPFARQQAAQVCADEAGYTGTGARWLMHAGSGVLKQLQEETE